MVASGGRLNRKFSERGLMNRRHFLGSAAALTLGTGPLAHLSAHAAMDGASSGNEDSSLRHSSADRFQLTLERVLHGKQPQYTPEFILEDIRATSGRRFTNFSGDVSGRWIGAISSATFVSRERYPILDDVVHQVIALQHEEGYFGSGFHFNQPDDQDMALLWGNGRLLVGLTEYFELTGDSAVLASAKRLGDFLVRISPTFNSVQMADDFNAAHFATSYICWTQQTEGLARLYALTKDTRYRDLCAAICERIERRPGDHVHGYLSSLRGEMMLYTETKDEKRLRHVEAAWDEIMHSGDVLITGGVPEAWSPKKLRTEGCAECDWLRLNLSLWNATRNNKYLEMAENILFNEFAMNQFSSGDFGHAKLSEIGTPELVSIRAWWCCTLHGLRALSDVQHSVFRFSGNDVFYDFPIDGEIECEVFSGRAVSHLDQNGTIQIAVSKVLPDARLIVQKPSWAHAISVSIGERRVAGEVLSGLQPGDHIVLKYEMALHRSMAGNSPSLSQRESFHLGPWLLGVSELGNKGYYNELQSKNVLGSTRVEAKTDFNDSPFTVPAANVSAAYIPAEFPDQPDVARMRPVAEQTASGPTRWSMAFLVK